MLNPHIAFLRRGIAALALPLLLVAPVRSVHAQSEPYIGQLMLFAGNFCPQGWLMAAGQTLAIQQNTALFSILGTTYGGNGVDKFMLPDLRGRAPIGAGQGPGLSIMQLGQVGGTESVTLSQTQMPAHTHTAAVATPASKAPATYATPGPGRVVAQSENAGVYAVAPAATDANATTLAGPTVTLAIAGNSQAFSVRNPYLAMNWCIAVNGVFPPHP